MSAFQPPEGAAPCPWNHSNKDGWDVCSVSLRKTGYYLPRAESALPVQMSTWTLEAQNIHSALLAYGVPGVLSEISPQLQVQPLSLCSLPLGP